MVFTETALALHADLEAIPCPSERVHRARAVVREVGVEEEILDILCILMPAEFRLEDAVAAVAAVAADVEDVAGVADVADAAGLPRVLMTSSARAASVTTRTPRTALRLLCRRRLLRRHRVCGAAQVDLPRTKEVCHHSMACNRPTPMTWCRSNFPKELTRIACSCSSCCNMTGSSSQRRFNHISSRSSRCTILRVRRSR
mmetsp:Transcript_30940/g.82153  ORF Transcript_30940/g.82153 Transcript_30940/m.82153 type:complete len:200 (+) Transcript_30940:854-1453(+)